jgi:hypothetical protein
VQELVYDLGAVTTVDALKYTYCTCCGFTNGAVRDFKLSVSNSPTSGWSDVLTGSLPEGTNAQSGALYDRDHQMLFMPATEGKSGRCTA